MADLLAGGVWIVVPAYNEAPRLTTTLAGLCAIDHANVVVVDDGSADTTAVTAQSYPVWVVRHPINCGQGAAVRTGIDFALDKGADVIVTFDADGQHRASDIERLVEPIQSGSVDVVLGSRFLGQTEGMPAGRRLLLKLAVWFTRLTCGLPITDAHNGLRAFSRRAAEQIRIEQPRMAHASEILDQVAWHSLSFGEVPVTIRYSAETLHKGQSSWDAVRITSQLVMGRFAK